jgi:hypothetical protein
MRPTVSVRANPPVMVSQLIDATTATWNKNLIREVFLPMEENIIFPIPLCTRRQDDFWAWNFEHKGSFMVCSAYRIMIATKISREKYLQGNAGSSSSESESRGWSTLWRLAQHSLPTTDLLEHRHMCTTSTCTLCGMPDSWRHYLLECNMADSVWALADEG